MTRWDRRFHGSLVRGDQPSQAFGYRPRAGGDRGYEVGGVGGAPEDGPGVVGHGFDEWSPDGAGECGDAGGGDAVEAASGGDEGGGGADAFDGAFVDGGGEAGGAAHFNGELVEFWCLGVFGEQEGFLGEG